MIATCLKGEALEVYKTVGTEERKNYATVKETLQTAFRAEDQKFTALSEFHGRSMFPNETPQRYLFELKLLLIKAFPQMDGQAKEQLVFEQYIRGLPKVVYENIRISSELKTSQDALRRAQVLIRMHNESSENSQCEIMAAVQLKEDSHALDIITPSPEAIDEAVKIISERLKLPKISEDDNYVCATRRGFGNRRSWDGRQRKLICFECHGEGHYAEECPSRRKIKQNTRCYICGRLGHIMKNCTQQASGRTLNPMGPVGRVKTRSQKY